MQSASSNLFIAIIQASKARLKDEFYEQGVTLQWDLNNDLLKGTFSIPIQGNANKNTGLYEITAKEFLTEE